MSDLTGQYLGQYQILARISKGSTSTIYKAYQAKLDRFVAIKVLSPHVVDEEGFLDRFTQEARAVAQLDHPNIVPVYDFDHVGDTAYIVLKYVHSGTLRAMMAGSPLDLGLAVDMVTQMGLALGYAHRCGVIHRDVKPGNILIGEGRWAMLTDFGLAKILDGGKKLTRSGVGMGTPDYMSPEQAQGLPGDGRTDLYSLGVTLYEMVTGQVPFQADSSMGVVVKHITQAPPPPRQFNTNLPEAVEQVILTALEKDPCQRFQSAEAMVAALVRAAGPADERTTVTGPDLAALNMTRPRPRISPLTRLKKTSTRIWKRFKDSSTNALKTIKTSSWDHLTRRKRATIGGAVAGLILLIAVMAGLASRRPAEPARLLPTVMPTWTPAATAERETSNTAGNPARTPTPAPAGSPTPAPTSEWTYLPSTATIRPGIYVRVVRPAGVELFKAAGFDGEWILTMPVGKILYVRQGPVRANSLSWIQMTDGATAGWGVQDYVAPYGIKNTP
jgi:serine/threonine protein kinase